MDHQIKPTLPKEKKEKGGREREIVHSVSLAI